jgi:hypothetical protein
VMLMIISMMMVVGVDAGNELHQNPIVFFEHGFYLNVYQKKWKLKK